MTRFSGLPKPSKGGNVLSRDPIENIPAVAALVAATRHLIANPDNEVAQSQQTGLTEVVREDMQQQEEAEVE